MKKIPVKLLLITLVWLLLVPTSPSQDQVLAIDMVLAFSTSSIVTEASVRATLGNRPSAHAVLILLARRGDDTELTQPHCVNNMPSWLWWSFQKFSKWPPASLSTLLLCVHRREEFQHLHCRSWDWGVLVASCFHWTSINTVLHFWL